MCFPLREIMSPFCIEGWEEPFSYVGVFQEMLTGVSVMISPQFQEVYVMCDVIIK